MRNLCLLLLLRGEIVTEQEILVPEVELTVCNDRMGPGLHVASLRLLEPAHLLQFLGGRLDEGHGAILAAQIEMSLGKNGRSLACAAFPVGKFAALQVHAGEHAAA